jgi:predicted N-acetyltransferase YhbS
MATVRSTEDPAGGEVTIRTFHPGDEGAIVELLNSSFPGGWGDEERWRAKHSGRPDFNPEDIYLAELDGRIIGCLHTAIVPVRISAHSSLPLSLDGDLAVHPDGRGKSIPERLYQESRRRLHERGIPLRGGYTQEQLWTRFYKPRIGYVSDFDTTLNFKKVLDPAPVRDRLLALFGTSPAAPDPGHGPVLEVRVTGLPPFRLRLGPSSVAPIAGTGGTAAVIVAADQRIFSIFGERSVGIRGLMALWRSGGLGVFNNRLGLFHVGWWYVTRGRRLMRRGVEAGR